MVAFTTYTTTLVSPMLKQLVLLNTADSIFYGETSSTWPCAAAAKLLPGTLSTTSASGSGFLLAHIRESGPYHS